MKFEHQATIAAPVDQVWKFLLDVPRVAKCAPGVEEVEPLEDGKYRGTLKVNVGPIRLTLKGDLTILEQDEAVWKASMRADAADRGAGGAVKAVLTMQLVELPGATPSTQLNLEADAQIMGRIGEFGQPVIRKKADQMVGEFTKNIQAAILAG